MTKARLFCKLRNPRRISATVAGAAVLALVAVAVWVAPARASDNAPEWFRTAASQTLPEYSKETSAVVLYDEEIITVKDSGEIEVTRRPACQIVPPGGVQEVRFPFLPIRHPDKVASFQAWTIMP